MDSDPYAPPADIASTKHAAMQNDGDMRPDDLRCPAVVVNMRILYTALGILMLWLFWRASARLENVLLAGLFFVPPLFSVLLPGKVLTWWIGVVGGAFVMFGAVFVICLIAFTMWLEESSGGLIADLGQMNSWLIPLIVLVIGLRLIWVTAVFIFSDRSRRWHRVGNYRRTSAASVE